MRVEYKDGRIHNVECYRFCKAILDNGEKIYFIEYKDFTDKQNGEFEDCYAIVANNNGTWQKIERKIEYDVLASKVVEEFDPQALGAYLGFAHNYNTHAYIPQTQTQPQREKIDLEDTQPKLNERYISENNIPQTQTQPQRQRIDPEDINNNMEEIFIPVKIDDNGIVVDTAFDVYASLPGHHNRIAGEYFARGLSYNSTTRKEIYRIFGTFATFDYVKIPYGFIELFDKQNERIRDSNGQILFVNLEDIIYNNKIYRFVPTKFQLDAVYGSHLDIKLHDRDLHLNPKEILEFFGDYRLNEGYQNNDNYIQKVPYRKHDELVRKTNDVEHNVSNVNQSEELSKSSNSNDELLKLAREELVESKEVQRFLREENDRLKKENDRLKKEKEELQGLIEAFKNRLELEMSRSNTKS